ncbi:MAG: hypothetical protein KDD82_08965, partial [Planctomycetes bacterium]|nr:hypothetical protein [Planctomycetota bacterium]
LCFALRAGLYDDAKALARLCLNDGWADGTRAFANAALGVAATFAPQAKDEANALALSCFEVASRLAPDDSFTLAAQGLAEPNRPAQAWRVELAVRARNLAISGDGAASRAYRAGLRWAEAAGAGRERASYQRARRAFVRAEQLHPLHAPALLARGRLYAAWSERGLAQAAVSRALELDPRSVSGHVVQGELQLRFAGAGPADLRLARKTFEHAVSLAGSPETGGSDAVEAYFGRAQVALAEAEQLAPEEPARAARIAQAREDLTLALDATPDRYPAGRPQDVRFALRLLEALRDLCRDHGSPEQARDFATRLEETRAAARAAAEKLRAQARALRDALRNREALEVLGVAQALAPEEGAVYFERGLCYLKVGSFVPGIVDLSRALELNPRLADEVYAKVYQITYVVDLHRVITELDKIVADHPDEAHVIFLRGFFFVARVEFKEYTEGDLLRGIEDFDRCLALNPRHVTARLYRGFLEFKRANADEGVTPEEVQAGYAKALADYQAALELDPGSALSHYLQALLWAQRLRDAGAAEEQREGFRARALQHFQRALELGFRAFDRVKNEAAFDALRDDEDFLRLLGEAR